MNGALAAPKGIRQQDTRRRRQTVDCPLQERYGGTYRVGAKGSARVSGVPHDISWFFDQSLITNHWSWIPDRRIPDRRIPHQWIPNRWIRPRESRFKDSKI